MRVALLSNGPSLAQAWEDAQACGKRWDVRIGVNAAATLYEVDWWCAGDWQVFYPLAMRPVGLPHVFTMAASAREIERRGRLAWMQGRQLLPWIERGQVLTGPKGWHSWSSTAALMLAMRLGAVSVDVFGVDLAGDQDCTGRPGTGRGQKRWERELPAWTRAVSWLSDHGVCVTRHQPREVAA